MRNEDIHRLVDGATADLISALDRGQSERLTEYLAAMGRFHEYSLGNALLIAVQRPDARHVAGYRTWQGLGRQVRQGEKGILIVAPIVKRGSKAEGGNESAESRATEEETIVAFRGAYIFDISQTEGRPLVEFAKVEGNPSHHLQRLRALISGQGIDLAYSDALGSAYGLSCGGKILIRSGLGPAEEFSVLVHELAHEMLHKQGQAEQKTSRKIRETEAEAAAFVVSQAVGLECGTAASDYIQLYDGKKETLMASLERIQATAREIIKAVIAADGGEAETASREASPAITAVAA
jgi:antirestriction protein ArdC